MPVQTLKRFVSHDVALKEVQRYCVENQSLSVATGQILLKGIVTIELSGVVVMLWHLSFAYRTEQGEAVSSIPCGAGYFFITQMVM